MIYQHCNLFWSKYELTIEENTAAVADYSNYSFQDDMANVLGESYDMNLASFGVAGIVNIVEGRALLGYIAVLGEMQPAFAEQGDIHGALHNILLYPPSFQTPPQCY